MDSEDSAAPRAVTACLLVIGDEVLSGRTRDANLPYLARWLGEIGIQLREARVVPDVPQVIADAVLTCRQAFDYLFTTGGIGPTHDDRTTVAVARAFGAQVTLSDEAVARLEAYYGPGQLNEARLKMAHVPTGARLIDNPITGAPGFQLENVLVLPGIPRLVQAMLEVLRPRLTGGQPLRSATLRALYRESDLAPDLTRLVQEMPGIQVGSYPFFQGERPGVSLVIRTADEALLARARDALRRLLLRVGAELLEES
jgi:molybdenum cofactor synthesis domain-containing protein